MKLRALLIISFISINLFGQNDWQLLNPSPTIQQGFQIDFVDENHGFILTNKNLLETFDFGENWSINIELISASDFDFSSNIGVIVGASTDNRITFNSGLEWQSLNVPADGFKSVKLFESGKIYLTSSTKLYISENYGTSWITYNLPYGQVVKSFFINEEIGYICSQNGEISKTSNGGQNWDLQYDYQYIPGNFKTIYFANENLGFAFRDHSGLLRTDDGGETWTETDFPYDIYDFQFVNDQVGFMAGEMGKIYKTVNGGLTWTPKNYDNTIYGTPWYFGIYFKSESEGIACGQRGMIIKTTTSGNSWQPYSFLYDPIWGGQLFGEIGYVHTLADLYKTTDGGLNWFTSNKPTNIGMVRNVQFFDENSGIMLAGSPTSDDVTKLFKTNDGGQTWSILNGESSRRIRIEFVNENLGFAYAIAPGYHMQITTNGGKSFQNLGWDTNYYDFDFVTENIGFSRNYLGNRIFKTLDGGHTWDNHYQASDTIYDTQFINEQIGYMVSGCCRVYKTEDGGVTWNQTATSPVSDYINKISFYTSEKGYVIDDDGIIYHTSNGGQSWTISTNEFYYRFVRDIHIIDNHALLYGDNGIIAKVNTNEMNVSDFPINTKFQIQIYPNPVTEILNIEIDEPLTFNKIEIYDMTGKLVLSTLSNKNILSTKNIDKGIYILKVYTKQNEIFSTKFIKE